MDGAPINPPGAVLECVRIPSGAGTWEFVFMFKCGCRKHNKMSLGNYPSMLSLFFMEFDPLYQERLYFYLSANDSLDKYYFFPLYFNLTCSFNFSENNKYSFLFFI